MLSGGQLWFNSTISFLLALFILPYVHQLQETKHVLLLQPAHHVIIIFVKIVHSTDNISTITFITPDGWKATRIRAIGSRKKN